LRSHYLHPHPYPERASTKPCPPRQQLTHAAVVRSAATAAYVCGRRSPRAAGRRGISVSQHRHLMSHPTSSLPIARRALHTAAIGVPGHRPPPPRPRRHPTPRRHRPPRVLPPRRSGTARRWSERAPTCNHDKKRSSGSDPPTFPSTSSSILIMTNGVPARQRRPAHLQRAVGAPAAAPAVLLPLLVITAAPENALAA
jgi:hypothetical protein